MLRALDEYVIGGVTTLLGFHRALLRHPCFVDGGTCHGIVESEQLARAGGGSCPGGDRGSARRRTAGCASR